MADILRFVDLEESLTGGGTVYLDINDGTDYCLNEIQFPAPKPRIEYRDPSHGDGRDVSFSKWENRIVTITMNVFGTDEDDLSTNARALWAELLRENPILEWQADGWTDPLYFDLITPPMEINTPDWFETWIRDNDTQRILSDVELVLEAKPFMRGPEESVILLNGSVASPDVVNCVTGIVKDETNFKGDVPAPADIYIDLVDGDLWTDLIFGQRLKYHDDFDPIQEPTVGTLVDPAPGRLNDDHRFMDVPVNLLAAFEPSFEDVAGSGITSNWAHWTEARGGYTGVYMQDNAGAYNGAHCIEVGCDNDPNLIADDPGFEAWTGMGNLTNWAETSGGGGLAKECPGLHHSGVRSVNMDSDNDSIDITTANYIAVDITEYYRLQVWAYNFAAGSSGHFILRCKCYDVGSGFLGNIDVYHGQIGTPLNAWKLFAYDITPAQFATLGAVTKVKITLECHANGAYETEYYHFDDIKLYQRTYRFEESVTSEYALIADITTPHPVLFYGKTGGASGVALDTVLTVYFYAGAAPLGSKVLYTGDLEGSPTWKLFSQYIQPTDFPATTNQVKLKLSRTSSGRLWVDDANLKVCWHYWDLVAILESNPVEAAFSLDAHEGRYLPVASVSFADSTNYSNVTAQALLATSTGDSITPTINSLTVDTGDPDTKFMDVSMLSPRMSVITIPTHRISNLADKSQIDQIFRIVSDPSCIENFWYDYIGIVPIDRAYSEVRNWSGNDHLILDGRSSHLALTSLTGSLDDAQTWDIDQQKGDCSFVADPKGFNGAILALTNTSGDYEVTSVVDVTMKYSPLYILMPVD